VICLGYFLPTGDLEFNQYKNFLNNVLANALDIVIIFQYFMTYGFILKKVEVVMQN